jgi:hypothetical protein
MSIPAGEREMQSGMVFAHEILGSVAPVVELPANDRVAILCAADYRSPLVEFVFLPVRQGFTEPFRA